MAETIASYRSNLSAIQSISKKKIKKTRALQVLVSSFVILEYGLYVLLYYLLIQWKIDSEVTTIYLYLLAVILGVFTIISMNRGLLQLQNYYGWVEEFFQLSKVIFYTFMITIGLLFILKTSVFYSRAIIILFGMGMLAISWGIRLLKRGLLAWLAYENIYARNALIIGAGKIGQNLFSRLKSSKFLGYRVIGYLDDFKSVPEVKGSLQDMSYVIQKYDVDEIFITIPSERSMINNLLPNLLKYPVKIKIIPELYDLVTTKVSFEQVDTFPFVEFVERKQVGWHAFIKRTVDIFLSLIGIIFLSPVLVVLWVLVKKDSPGPAVFKQQRIGKDGVSFHIFKFRTMVSNAQDKLKADPRLYKKYIENNYKLEPHEDPRITKLGHFLRRSSLDELPQLFNVFKGDMSLVGPRPVIEEELREYQSRVYDFLSVKPGVTGYWQVGGRSGVGYPERVDVELFYVYNQSIMLDLKILFKTVAAVLKRDGAY
jgi:exopolysaccharide biosynthesis polyprenyl glycosylphosphotransferase